MTFDGGTKHSLGRLSGARALVFGASGFIGRWVARKLCEAGADVALAVRDPKAAEAIFERFGVRGAVHPDELTAPGSGASVVRRLKPQVVFNLAGYGIDRSEKNESVALRINAELVRELVRALAEVRDPAWEGAHLVHVGSAAEYGSATGDLAEDTKCKPTTMYGRTKLLGTLELLVRADQVGIRALSARLFTVYGPGEHPGRLLPLLFEAADNYNPLQLTGGLQKRDFTYVEDAAEGLLRLALAKLGDSEIVNLATGKLATVRSFAMAAAGALGIPLESLRFGALPTSKDEMDHGDVNIARLLALTGWSPTTSIAEGVSRTLAFDESKV